MRCVVLGRRSVTCVVQPLTLCRHPPSAAFQRLCDILLAVARAGCDPGLPNPRSQNCEIACSAVRSQPHAQCVVVMDPTQEAAAPPPHDAGDATPSHGDHARPVPRAEPTAQRGGVRRRGSTAASGVEYTGDRSSAKGVELRSPTSSLREKLLQVRKCVWWLASRR